jgi:hypothetical protein
LSEAFAPKFSERLFSELSPMTPLRSTADWIAAIRARVADRGLTHLEVDHRAGIADGLTSKILCGMKKRPSAATLMKISDAVELALLFGPEEKTAPPHDRALR